jgi:hypothetical protein
MVSSEDKIYIGYHGTDASCVESICKEGFRISDKENEWLGHGVYFFTQGISDLIPLKMQKNGL